MLFNSHIFIFVFLPATLLLYFLFGRFRLHRWQQIELIAASLIFYGYFNPWYLFIICGSILVNFGFSKLLLTQRIGQTGKKAILTLAILANLGLLFYYKYFDFFIENVNALLSTGFSLRNVILPLGISFFTFQQLSFVVDSYRGETDGYSFLDYACFVTFFPQLVAGPIVLHGQMIPQFQNTANLRVNYANLSRGLYLFAIGLCKKVILADTLGKAVAWGFGDVAAMSSIDAILVMLSYTFQIYFDFSGYCDMATGIAAMFNIDLPMNFNSPYKAVSIVDFWDRWHMSLTNFLREYLYFPLGGSRKGKARSYLNILIVFLASGIWHGANWTFIVWGLLHGVASILTRIFQKAWNRMHVVSQWLITFIFINFSWLLFRADSISQAIAVFKNIVSLNNMKLTVHQLQRFSMPEVSFVMRLLGLQELSIVNLAVLLALSMFIVLNCRNCYEKEFRPTAVHCVITVLLLIWSIVSLTGVSVFLYFNF